MQRWIRGLARLAIFWSIFPWGFAAVLCLLCALLPDPGSIISFKVPWWVVIVVWTAGPLHWGLVWSAQKSRVGLWLLTAFVGFWVGLGLWKEIGC